MTYQATTEDIRVTVRPAFIVGESDPSADQYVFGYRIRIENLRDDVVQLLYRHWFIHDSGGEDSEVEGEGVVGEQPVLSPGERHEYRSYCVLSSPAGHMEGHYTFTRGEDGLFDVVIPRFDLQAPLTPPSGTTDAAGDEVFH